MEQECLNVAHSFNHSVFLSEITTFHQPIFVESHYKCPLHVNGTMLLNSVSGTLPFSHSPHPIELFGFIPYPLEIQVILSTFLMYNDLINCDSFKTQSWYVG